MLLDVLLEINCNMNSYFISIIPYKILQKLFTFIGQALQLDLNPYVMRVLITRWIENWKASKFQ